MLIKLANPYFDPSPDGMSGRATHGSAVRLANLATILSPILGLSTRKLGDARRLGISEKARSSLLRCYFGGRIL